MLKLLTAGLLASVTLSGGVVTSTGYGVTENEACTNAKKDAIGVATVDAARHGSIANVRISSYSSCRCQSSMQTTDPRTAPIRQYNCTVDANYTQ